MIRKAGIVRAREAMQVRVNDDQRIACLRRVIRDNSQRSRLQELAS
ncbi:MAG: hypothetical protein ACREEM_24870 [Blastocatellia bacterium]